MPARLGSRPVLALAVTALTIAAAAGAAEALDPDHYALNTKNFTVSPGQFGGDYLSCPTGDRIVAGGAFWHASGSGTPIPNGGVIANSTPTTDGNGWYATAANGSAGTIGLKEVALCLPVKRVGKYALKTRNFTVSYGQFGGDYLSCPTGDRIVAGGAFWHAIGSGTPIPNGGIITDSTPTTDGKGWYAIAESGSAGTIGLEEVALCLPLKRVGKYALKTRNFTVSSGQFGGDYLSCPKRRRIVAGGAFWHASGSGTPIPNGGIIANSTPTTDGNGWYATAVNYTGGALQLEEVVLCL